MKFLKSLFGGGPVKLEEKGDELRLDFEYRDASHFYHRALEALGGDDPDGAERLRRKLREVRRQALGQLLEEAIELQQAGDYSMTREKLDMALSFADDDAARGEVERRKAELEEIEAMALVAPDVPEAPEGSDDAYELALAAFEEADRARAEALGTAFRAGYEASAAERWPEARRQFEALLEQHPDDLLLLEFAATAAEGTGDYAAALTMFERAQALTPYRPVTVLGLVGLFRRDGREDDTNRILADAAAHRPVTRNLSDAWVDVHMEYALSLARRGNHDDAAGALLRLLDAEAADHGHVYYNLAGVLEAAGKMSECRAALERAMAAAPRRALYLERMADVLVKEGKNLDLAIDYLVAANEAETTSPSGAVTERAVGSRMSPHRARYLYKTARVYFLKGQDLEAERTITTAIAISRDETVTKALEDLRREIRAAGRKPS